MTDREKLYKKIIRQSEKIIADCRQAIRDYEWWNKNNPQHPPLDIEPERVLLSKEIRVLSLFRAGDSKGSARLAGENVAYMQRVFSEGEQIDA